MWEEYSWIVQTSYTSFSSPLHLLIFAYVASLLSTAFPCVHEHTTIVTRAQTDSVSYKAHDTNWLKLWVAFQYVDNCL